MKIALGADHAGFAYKEIIKKMLVEAGHEVQDFGTHSEESVDYPDFSHPVAKSITEKDALLGILFCGSGNGVAMAANKHPNIRCALCWNDTLAGLARTHNDANVLAIPARFIDVPATENIVKAFLNNSFEGGRHQKRVDKISC